MLLTSDEQSSLQQVKSMDMSTDILSPVQVLTTGNSTTSNGTNQPVVSLGPMAVVASDQQQCNNEQFCCKWSECMAVFKSLEDLVSHVSDLHVKAEVDETYRCHWKGCPRNGKGFNARYKVLIHVRTHTNEKPHACYFCGKHFSRLESLKIHKRTHTGEKPYVCPYEGCSKAYSNSSDRFKHALTHRIDRPYSCKMPGCIKRYTDPSSLRKHMRAHGHHLITNIEASNKEKTTCTSQPTVTTSTEGNGMKLPGCTVSSVIQDGQSSIAKIPQLPYAVARLPALVDGTFCVPNLIPNTILPLVVIPMSVNCSKILETDRKTLSDVSVLVTDTFSPGAVL